ncbi:MAG: PH domain-containing protein [Actinomycetaceae bacterium]|nr:PH domain-containing protein [Actinomycetaceae bacterium]
MAKKESITEIGLDPQQWRALHPLTPISQTWSALAALLGILTWQTYDELSKLFSPEVIWGPGYWGYSMFTAVLFVFLTGSLLIALLVGIYSYFAWRKMRYAITPEAVYFKEGIISRNQRSAKLNRIQAVNITHPFFGRIFGLGRIDIEVAGGAGSNLQFGLLKTSELEAVRLEILHYLRAAKNGETPVATTGVLGNENQPAATLLPGETNPTAPAAMPTATPVTYGLKDAVTNAEIEGNLIFSVPVSRLLLSQAVNIGVLVSLLFGIASIVGSLVLFFVFEGGFGALLGTGSFAFVIFSAMFNTFASNFNFRAYLAEDGIRIRAGLLETRSQTIAPHRIHAVHVEQPFFWRFFDWYRVRITQAAFQDANASADKADVNILLPVGTRADMLRAVWMIYPDLGVADPLQTLRAGIEGTGDGNGFINNPKRARIFNWITYNRNAHCLTDKVLLVRKGRITRNLTITSFSRLQSMYLAQGPLARWKDLAVVHLSMVGGAFSSVETELGNVDGQIALRLFEELKQRSSLQRSLENPQAWAQRVHAGLDTEQSYQAVSAPSPVTAQLETSFETNQITPQN